MLPRRRLENAAQDLSEDECDADAAFATKPPLAKTRSISKVLTFYTSVTIHLYHHELHVPGCHSGIVRSGH